MTSPASLDEGDYQYLFDTYGPDKFNLSDRGYIAQIHPLELWLVGYLRAHPAAGWSEIVDASAKQRIEVYDWLINTSHKNAQDIRILSRLEIEAFQELHKRWRRLGYPFGSLVPSYATAIGSSADRPAALAELMGVITNDGEKLEPVTLTRIEFAADTPYHTIMKRKRQAAERIFPTEIASVIKKALANVVNDGTARRLRGSFKLDDGTLLPIGGKTGTGDHRLEVYAANGTVIESKVMNRTATFAFYLGARFFGVMTVFVPGEAAADFHFTSAIAVQIVKDMEPALRPLILGNEKQEPSWEDLVKSFDAETTARSSATPIASAMPSEGSQPVTPSAPSAQGIKPMPPSPKATHEKSRNTPEKPVAKAPTMEPNEPPPAPPPPQVDKPDPLPPPAASEPNQSISRQNPFNPWAGNTGEGFKFVP